MLHFFDWKSMICSLLTKTTSPEDLRHRSRRGGWAYIWVHKFFIATTKEKESTVHTVRPFEFPNHTAEFPNQLTCMVSVINLQIFPKKLSKMEACLLFVQTHR